MAMGKC